MSPDATVESLKRRFVARLRSSGAIRSSRVEQAFLKVDRHIFVTSYYERREDGSWSRVSIDEKHSALAVEELSRIYSNRSIVTRVSPNGQATSSSSQPSLMAEMLELLDVAEGMKVLEIGAGSGYNAALLAALTTEDQRVISVDNKCDVVAEAREHLAAAGFPAVSVACGDGFLGFPECAPYDRIVVTAGCPDSSPEWLHQLREGGRIVLPLSHRGLHMLIRVERVGEMLLGSISGICGFMPMEGVLHYSEEANGQASKISREVVLREPVWEGLAVGNGNSSADVFRSGFLGFWYFASLCDWRVTMGDGITLEDAAQGRVTIDEKEVVVCGRPQLLEAMRRLYREWTRLGGPQLCEYRMALAQDRTSPPSELLPCRRVWSMPRRYFNHMIILP